jgi:CheY-like chemotaxis protein
MKILLLEDDPNRVEQFQQRVKELNERNNIKFELVHVETAKDCIDKLETDKFKLVLLDHDLGGEVYVDTDNTNTGSEVARWMNKNPDKIKGVSIITHTFNPAGAKNIVALVPQCGYVPSIWTKDKFHQIVKIV